MLDPLAKYDFTKIAIKLNQMTVACVKSIIALPNTVISSQSGLPPTSKIELFVTKTDS